MEVCKTGGKMTIHGKNMQNGIQRANSFSNREARSLFTTLWLDFQTSAGRRRVLLVKMFRRGHSMLASALSLSTA